VGHAELIGEKFDQVGWIVGRTLPLIKDENYHASLTKAAHTLRTKIDELGRKTPYGVPYEPKIWGAGWQIQRFGAEQVFLHQSFPDIFPTSYLLNALNFILGCHPGSNTTSFVSGHETSAGIRRCPARAGGAWFEQHPHGHQRL